MASELKLRVQCEVCRGEGTVEDLVDGIFVPKKCGKCEGDGHYMEPAASFPGVTDWIDEKAWELYSRWSIKKEVPDDSELCHDMMNRCLKNAEMYYLIVNEHWMGEKT